jgi:CRISPR/Cas system-associated exonuclease Cas4 (RecB family)
MSQGNRTSANHNGSDSLISKSKFLWGLQCPKLLWYAYNAKDLIPEPDAATLAIFEQGHEVGALAKQVFRDGVEVGDGVLDLEENVRLTQKALKLRKPLFEAAFSAEGGFCRVDILRPALNDAWDIIEVKSTTSLKDVHLEDLGFQAWVLAMAGIKIRASYLMHINPDFVRRGEIDPKKFFTLENVTDQAANLGQLVEGKLGDMFKTIRQRQHPDINIGPHCDDPYTCALHDHCWSFLPEHNVLDLYRGTKKGFGLLNQGVKLLKDIPGDIKLTASQAIQRATAIAGKPHVNKQAISKFLGQLRYPVSYLDFETLGTAIPLFDGVRPYQQVPFQFSLHIVRAPGAMPEHIMFLAEGRHDPRPEFMLRLRDAIGCQGSVVAFNASFELGRLRECCEAMPNFSAWLKSVEGRVVDLLEPFRSFDLYDPIQGGGASMKAVLPALTGKGYEGLAIQEGGMASREFLRVTFGDVAAEERKRVRQELEAYCGQDTEGMIWITDGLRGMTH